MSASDWVVRFAVSRTGAALDVYGVRYTGHSLVSFLFARTYGSPYNRPLLLETTGAKTGKRRRAVLPYFPAGGVIAIVGSRGGAPSDPNWVHNLRSNPEANVRIGRKLRRVHARIAEGDERAKLWAEISNRAPVYRTYQERAKTREIPVVVLDEIPGR